jgi:hypothetical protein
MAGTRSFINPSFPGNVSSQPVPPVGPRTEIFTHRASNHHYNWTVPAGVTFIKATVVGGGANAASTGDTTTLGQYATATGGVATSSTRGVFSVSTTKVPQNIGPSFQTAVPFIDFGVGSDGGTTGGNGGSGVVFLENMIPGTSMRIFVGASVSGSMPGIVVLEY